MDAARSTRAYLSLQNLSKTFPDGQGGVIRAVDGLSLDIAPGEFVTLIGPSGCGKTTTLRMIAGFEEPTAGRIVREGKDISGLPPFERNMPLVFQSYALFPHMTVFDNIAYGLKLRRMKRDAIAHDVAMACQMVNLVGTESRFPGELSGGQQQRVALARALVLKPKIMLFDEPLSNLDPKLRIQTRSEIKRVQQMLGITTVYVTHDQTEALSLSDRVAVMNHGKIAQLGSPEAVYNHPASPFVSDFIGSANFLDAIVDEVTSGHVVVRINGFPFSVPLDRCEPNPEPGGRVLVSVKPEAIELVSPVEPGEGSGFRSGPRGVVELSAFSGPATEYKVTFGDAYLTVSTPNIRGRTVVHRAGSEVGLEFDPSAFRVYPA